MRSLSNTSWWPGSALVAVAVNLRMTGFASMGVEELLMTVRWGSIHCFDLLLLFLELSQYFVQLRVLKEELLPEVVLHAVLSLGLCIWISFNFLMARALVTLSTLFSVYVASGMIVNWGMLPLASSCRCLSSVCINTSAALRFKKKKKQKKQYVYPETVDIWGLLQMLPPYIPNIWIKYLVIIFQHSLHLTPSGLNLWFNQISTSIFFLLEMQWRQNHSVYMWCPQMGGCFI